MYQYTYTKLLDPNQLSKNIEESSITIALDYINTSGANVDIFFKSDLSTEEQSILDSVVEKTTAEPLEENKVVKIKK